MSLPRSDFIFQLNVAEKSEVVTNCDHLQSLKYSRTPPYVFTEHGAIQAANVLASVQAVEMGIYVKKMSTARKLVLPDVDAPQTELLCARMPASPVACVHA